jgi:predicted TIM-barrel fold metal-dependent hydrolase
MALKHGIVDPHFHLIDVLNNPYPWFESRAPRPEIFAPSAPRPDIVARHGGHSREVFLAEDFKAATAGQNMIKAVHVQANWDPADPVGETRWLAGVAEQHGIPQGVVAYANLGLPTAEEILAGHASFGFTRGIRLILSWDEANPRLRFTDRPDYMSDEQWLKNYALLGKYNLSFDTQIYYSQMDETLALARRFPGIPIIVNHAGMPLDRTEEGLTNWAEAMKRLAAADNVSVKISGLGIGQPTWSVANCRDIVLTVIDAFGTDRSMFASNYPVDGSWADYDTLFDGFAQITADFTSDEQDKLFRRNAERIYRV